MRRGFSLVEVGIAAGLFAVLAGVLTMLLIHGGRSSARTGTQYALQQTSRVGMAHFLQELQEGMEVVQPAPGCTLPHAVIRDQVSCARWYYLVPQPDERGSYELWRYADDPDMAPADRKQRVLRGIRRLTFTAHGESAVQVNMVVKEGAEELPLLTTVRMRNVAAADDGW